MRRLPNRGTGLLVAALVILAFFLGERLGEEPGPSDREVVDRFHAVWAARECLFQNRWMGIRTFQNPFDVWITQEIIHEVRPDVIVETGTYKGGSAALWATLLEQVNPEGRVVTIDIEDKVRRAKRLPVVQERVTFLVGSSTDPEIVQEVWRLAEGNRVLVILDSAHTLDHVLAELEAYAPLVDVGSYVIVQDTVVNGNPLAPDWGPGPMEAVDAFLAKTDDFEIDASRERLLFTHNPRGFLKRVR